MVFVVGGDLSARWGEGLGEWGCDKGTVRGLDWRPLDDDGSGGSGKDLRFITIRVRGRRRLGLMMFYE